MHYTSNTIIKHKAGLLNLAEELQNASKACNIMGLSSNIFIDINNYLKRKILLCFN